MSDETESLDVLREALGACDRDIVEAMGRRMQIVERVASFKQERGLPTFDRAREADLLSQLEATGGEHGVSRDVVRDVYAVLFSASRDLQRDALARSLPKQSVGIIGGTNGMGAFFARVMRSAGFEVEVTGLDQGSPNIDVAGRHDLVIVAVPIVSTPDVIRQIAPHVKAGATLIDVTSVKRVPLAEMMAHANEKVNIVGTHPMFGPSSSGFDRQKVVLCRGRGDEAFSSLKRMFEAFGAECIEATPEEHDAQMALIQVLVHEKTMVLGSVLERLKAGLGRSLDFASPIYRTELAMIGRMFSQGADLYADILTSNPDASRLSHLFEQEAAHFARSISMGDRDAVVKRFKEVAAFMKDFASWAREQSDVILRDLLRHG